MPGRADFLCVDHRPADSRAAWLLRTMTETTDNQLSELAETVHRFMASHCLRMAGQLGEDYRTGVLSMFFNWRYLVYQLRTIYELDVDQPAIARAVAELREAGRIRTDYMGTYGVHVWLRTPVGVAA